MVDSLSTGNIEIQNSSFNFKRIRKNLCYYIFCITTAVNLYIKTKLAACEQLKVPLLNKRFYVFPSELITSLLRLNAQSKLAGIAKLEQKRLIS